MRQPFTREQIALGYLDSKRRLNLCSGRKVPGTGCYWMWEWDGVTWHIAFLKEEAYKALRSAKPGQTVKACRKNLTRMTTAEIDEAIKTTAKLERDFEREMREIGRQQRRKR